MKLKRGATICFTIQSGKRKRKMCRRLDKRTLGLLIGLDRKMDRMIDEVVK
jgi:hypothetical protein